MPASPPANGGVGPALRPALEFVSGRWRPGPTAAGHLQCLFSADVFRADGTPYAPPFAPDWTVSLNHGQEGAELLLRGAFVVAPGPLGLRYMSVVLERTKEPAPLLRIEGRVWYAPAVAAWFGMGTGPLLAFSREIAVE